MLEWMLKCPHMPKTYCLQLHLSSACNRIRVQFLSMTVAVCFDLRKFLRYFWHIYSVFWDSKSCIGIDIYQTAGWLFPVEIGTDYIIANIFSKWIKLSSILINHRCSCFYFLSTRTDFIMCKSHASAISYIVSLWWCPHTRKLWRDVPVVARLPRDEAAALGVTIKSTPCFRVYNFLRDHWILWTR